MTIQEQIDALESELTPLRSERCALVTKGDIFAADDMNRKIIRPKEAIVRELYLLKASEDNAGI